MKHCENCGGSNVEILYCGHYKCRDCKHNSSARRIVMYGCARNVNPYDLNDVARVRREWEMSRK